MTLEVLLTLPVLLILLLAIVQFGLFFLQLQQLALACRTGAEEASQTFNIPDEGDAGNPGDLVPATIAAAVTQQLGSSSIEPCSIILEYNVNAPFNEQVLRTNFTPNCTSCVEPNAALPINTVRVTVCVEMTELMPNCLATLGFDITGRTVQCTNTFCYESP